MANLNLSVTFLFFIAVLLCMSSIQGLSPTIAHAPEPFFLKHHMPPCIYSSLHSFIQSLPAISPNASQPNGFRLEKTAACGLPDTLLLRLSLFDSHGDTNQHEHELESLQKKFAVLLETFQATLKLRYQWAVIINGQYWIEYHLGSSNRSSVRNAASDKDHHLGASIFNTSAASDVLDCLPRSDVLVSHNNAAGAASGFDVLLAPHSLISQNNRFFLLMQGDCNLVLYTAAGLPLWSSRTRGMGSKCSLSLLHDGNLVISNENKRIWASGSSISCPSVFILIIQNDGNAVIYDMLTGLPIWATGTNQ